MRREIWPVDVPGELAAPNAAVSLPLAGSAELVSSKLVTKVGPLIPACGSFGQPRKICGQQVPSCFVEHKTMCKDAKSIISGPFRFKDFDKAKGTYLYEAHPDYYLGKPIVDRLIYIKAGKPLMTLLSGKADLVNIKPEMADPLKDKGMTIIENQRGWNKKLMNSGQP